ncbi:hypothetical protein [Nostoc sp. C052]|uniref:hypothetical protein n=1 Tax=Nostoc sp. C052 TaxID=2576902 RepID=UPI0015C3A9A6|nr:hypothetical protein [Nostoc sp. C052]
MDIFLFVSPLAIAQRVGKTTDVFVAVGSLKSCTLPEADATVKVDFILNNQL